MYSTVEDLYRWEQALFTGEVVSQESWDAMLDAAAPMPGTEDIYAYGLITGEINGHPAIAHTGAIIGFVTVLAYLPEDDLTVIVLSNFEGAALDVLVDTIVRQLLD